MYTNLEIEFKCKIDKETYLKLLKEFYLANYVNKQTNYYFDTLDYKLRNKHITLRIREKEYNVKLTLKTNVSEGILEKNIILYKNDAKKMIEEGFNASIIGINEVVYNVAKLTTYRVKMDYKGGVLFFDKNIYYQTVDYEIEYEVTDKEEGYKVFLEFLKEREIPLVQTESKIARAYKKSSQ